MAFNSYNGYADDNMDIETSGPKVVVREVSSPSPYASLKFTSPDDVFSRRIHY
jgi:hypothetical protein